MTLHSENAATLDALVKALPELYQPVFGHPEYSGEARDTKDRVDAIKKCVSSISRLLGRPLRILDLGCAQGFICFSLAADGHDVTGVDYQTDNLALCNALAAAHPELKIKFHHDTIESFVDRIIADDYDIVLGLSVFHHIAHGRGLGEAQRLIGVLAERVAIGIYELAVKSEPLYWAETLPEDHEVFLSAYPFVHEVASHGTHLSGHERPLLFASAKHWWFEGSCETFTEWKSQSHAISGNVHQNTRRYFFSKDKVAKRFRLTGALADINKVEMQQEGDVLLKIAEISHQPSLITYGYNESESWLVRGLIEGKLLLDILSTIKPDHADRIISNILDQLVSLQDLSLFHNDVSIWNIIIQPNGEAVLIDYGAITTQAVNCVWPKDLFHAFVQFVYTISTHYPSRVLPVRRPYISATNLPDRYRHWITAYVEKNTNWQPRLLLELFNKIVDQRPQESVPIDGNDTWRASMEQHLDILGDNISAIQTNQSHMLQLMHRHEDLQKDLESRIEFIKLVIDGADRKNTDEIAKIAI